MGFERCPESYLVRTLVVLQSRSYINITHAFTPECAFTSALLKYHPTRLQIAHREPVVGLFDKPSSGVEPVPNLVTR